MYEDIKEKCKETSPFYVNYFGELIARWNSENGTQLSIPNVRLRATNISFSINMGGRSFAEVTVKFAEQSTLGKMKLCEFPIVLGTSLDGFKSITITDQDMKEAGENLLTWLKEVYDYVLHLSMVSEEFCKRLGDQLGLKIEYRDDGKVCLSRDGYEIICDRKDKLVPIKLTAKVKGLETIDQIKEILVGIEKFNEEIIYG